MVGFRLIACGVAMGFVLVSPAGSLFAQSQEELARAAQNPVASVVTPDTVPAADWQLRLQVQLMFPRK